MTTQTDRLPTRSECVCGAAADIEQHAPDLTPDEAAYAHFPECYPPQPYRWTVRVHTPGSGSRVIAEGQSTTEARARQSMAAALVDRSDLEGPAGAVERRSKVNTWKKLSPDPTLTVGLTCGRVLIGYVEPVEQAADPLDPIPPPDAHLDQEVA